MDLQLAQIFEMRSKHHRAQKCVVVAASFQLIPSLARFPSSESHRCNTIAHGIRRIIFQVGRVAELHLSTQPLVGQLSGKQNYKTWKRSWFDRSSPRLLRLTESAGPAGKSLQRNSRRKPKSVGSLARTSAGKRGGESM